MIGFFAATSLVAVLLIELHVKMQVILGFQGLNEK